MDRTGRIRSLLFRFACLMLAVGGGVFFSPLLAQESSGSTQPTCTATCTNGSCTGNKPYCVCSCGWFGSATCNCSAPPEQGPATGI